MIELHFEFKGERNYVQGGDIFNALSTVAQQSFGGGFVALLAFRSIARRQCVLAFENPASMAAVATGSIRAGDGQTHPFWLFEREEELVGRYPFDEEAIVRRTEVSIHDRSIRLLPDGSVTLIEYVIALTKRLNYLLSPDIDGKWLFGQLNLDVPLNGDGLVQVVQKSLLNGRMSVNEVWLGDVRVGTIRFVVGKP